MTSSNVASVAESVVRLAEGPTDEIVAVVGCTASGKTALAVEVASRIGGEIVSADSVQIYRWFDVGSGKPSAEDLARAPHRLVGTLDPMAPVDAAAWAESAARAIDQARENGRVPIVCGGTFLWVRALLFGLAPVPAANALVRARHDALASESGRAALHARLREVDVRSAERLHPNDLVRVSRALEVYELTGKPMSEWQREHGFSRVLRRARLVAIACDEPVLTARIEERARSWLANGWVDEVESLLARGYGPARAMGSVGYAQIRSMLDGQLSRDDLLGEIVRATRRFARRQRTWLKSADVTWLR